MFAVLRHRASVDLACVESTGADRFGIIVGIVSWGMAKNVDRIRARAAVATIRENPFLVGVVAVPVLVVAGVVWWLTNWFIALVVLVVLGAVVLVRGRIVR